MITHEAGAAAFRLAPRRPEDLEPLTDLWVASWQAAMPQIDFAARRAWFIVHLAKTEKGGGTTLCAFAEDGRLAGFILLRAVPGYLEQIAIDPRHFGSGLATQLLDAAKSLCPAGLALDVNADNPRALRFYEREGFARIGPGRPALSGLATLKLVWPARAASTLSRGGG